MKPFLLPLGRLPALLVNGVTVTLGLALVQCSISLAAGAAAAQVAIATAVCASLADVVATTDRVARRVLVAAVCSTVAATLYLLVREFEPVRLPTAALIVFGAMLLLSWGPKAASVAFATILSLVFAMSVPDTTPLTWDRFGWGLAGSAGYWVWAVATSRLLQPVWRTQALVSVAESMARLFAAIGRQAVQEAAGQATDRTGAPWQAEVLAEETALADRFQAARDLVFGHDGGPQARRETALLLYLTDLRDLAMASNIEACALPGGRVTPRQAELFGLIVQRMADALQVVVQRLGTGSSAVVDGGLEASVQQLLAELEHTASADRCDAILGVARLLASQLTLMRSIQQSLAEGESITLTCQRADLRRFISPDEWKLAAVAANLQPSAPVFRHAVRVAVTACLAYAVSRLVPWALHPQWILLTVAAVMQGNLAQTLLRRNARVLGTLAGCLVVVVLAASGSLPFLAACFLVASGVAHAFFPVRYSVTAGAAAVMALLQAHLVAPDTGFSTLERFGDTVVGALLGWGATYVLPTWERRHLPGALYQAVEALRAYAAEATRPEEGTGGLPRFARQRAYDAIRALGATRARSLVEPAGVRLPVPQLAMWLSAAYGLMSHLSNIRLALTLHPQESRAPALVGAMATAAQGLEAALTPQPATPPTTAPLPPDVEQALTTVPRLASRVQHALDDAGRLAVQSARIEALLQAPARE